MDFLVRAKQELWRAGRRPTEAWKARVGELLLEKLSQVGEITEDDRLWATELVEKTFPD